MGSWECTVIAVFIFSSLTDTKACPAGFSLFDGRCYHVSPATFATRNEALTYCDGFQNGRLVTPDRSSEADYITSDLSNSLAGSNSTAWLEATDIQTEGNWKCGNQQCQYTNWPQPTEPSYSRGGDCVVMDLVSGLWRANPCKDLIHSHHAICVVERCGLFQRRCNSDYFIPDCTGTGESVLITGVFFGRLNNEYCPGPNSDKVTDCESTTATTIIEQACNGQTTCSVRAKASNLGGDPCGGVYKILEVDYCCIMPPPTPLMTPSLCPSDFVLWEGSCYHFPTNRYNLTTDAVEYCSGYSRTSVLTPRTSEENDHVSGVIAAITGDPDALVWIHATDDDNDGVWQCGNTVCPYTNWLPPDEPITKCSSNDVMMRAHDGYWEVTSSPSPAYAACVIGGGGTTSTSQQTTTTLSPTGTSSGTISVKYLRIYSFRTPKEILENVGLTSLLQCAVRCTETAACAMIMFAGDTTAVAECTLLIHSSDTMGEGCMDTLPEGVHVYSKHE